jgi:hypothetical protein
MPLTHEDHVLELKHLMFHASDPLPMVVREPVLSYWNVETET